MKIVFSFTQLYCIKQLYQLKLLFYSYVFMGRVCIIDTSNIHLCIMYKLSLIVDIIYNFKILDGLK